VSFLHERVLRGCVHVTQLPLQWRALIEGATATQPEAGIDDA